MFIEKAYETFYNVWLKHKGFIFNITSKHITSASKTGLPIYPLLFYFNL